MSKVSLDFVRRVVDSQYVKGGVMKKIGKKYAGTIIITILNGCVDSVSGVPTGYRYLVCDLDVLRKFPRGNYKKRR